VIFLPAPSIEHPDVMLFGHGLVGQAVSDALQQQQARALKRIAYNWQDSFQRSETQTRLAAQAKAGQDIQIVWTAGRAGFGSTSDEMARETDLLVEILAFASDLAATDRHLAFHFTSSAGGLFEGLTEVTHDTVPQPQRPYGKEKIRQEQMVTQAGQEAGFDTRIYRLSSVYGYAPKARLGLISALIVNALNDTPTPITGDIDTLRDYVFAPDIGRFIVDQLAMRGPSCVPFLLASGTSASIATIIDLVQAGMSKPLLLDQQKVATNTAHMSFTPQSLPDGWTPSPLEDGIRQTIKLACHHLDEGHAP